MLSKLGPPDIKEHYRKKALAPCQKRDLVTEIKAEEGLSVAMACKIVSLVRCMYYYESVRDDSAVEAKLAWYGEKLPSRGFPEYFKRIRQEGLRWNHKRVRRVFRKLGMVHRRKIKPRIPNPAKQVLLQPI